MQGLAQAERVSLLPSVCKGISAVGKSAAIPEVYKGRAQLIRDG